MSPPCFSTGRWLRDGFDFSLRICVAKAASGKGVFSSGAADVGVSISSSLVALARCIIGVVESFGDLVAWWWRSGSQLRSR